MSANENLPAASLTDPAMAHIVPPRVLVSVFLVLLALTFITVAAARLELGGWALPVALGIATTKATLVALYFMHLRYDNGFYGIVFLTALLFLAIFLTVTLHDTFQYQPEVENWRPAGSGIPKT